MVLIIQPIKNPIQQSKQNKPPFQQKSPICTHYQKGNCKNGNQCKFQHIISGDQMQIEQGSISFDSSNHPQQNKPTFQQKSPICTHFLNGNCKKGNQCNFQHINSGDQMEIKKGKITFDNYNRHQSKQINMDIEQGYQFQQMNVTKFAEQKQNLKQIQQYKPQQEGFKNSFQRQLLNQNQSIQIEKPQQMRSQSLYQPNLQQQSSKSKQQQLTKQIMLQQKQNKHFSPIVKKFQSSKTQNTLQQFQKQQFQQPQQQSSTKQISLKQQVVYESQEPMKNKTVSKIQPKQNDDFEMEEEFENYDNDQFDQDQFDEVLHDEDQYYEDEDYEYYEEEKDVQNQEEEQFLQQKLQKTQSNILLDNKKKELLSKFKKPIQAQLPIQQSSTNKQVPQIKKNQNSTQQQKKIVQNNLSDSIYPMCTQDEVDDRENSQALDIFEIDPQSFIQGNRKANPQWIIKKYARPEADQPLIYPLSLNKLTQIANHLLDHIVDVDKLHKYDVPFIKRKDMDSHTFWDIYSFVSDRFRSINKDLTLLSEDPKIQTQKQTITVLEYIIRFHIISINDGREYENFSQPLNNERLTDALGTLLQCYKLSRQKIKSIFEQNQTKSLDQIKKIIDNEEIYLSVCEEEFINYNILSLIPIPDQMNQFINQLTQDEFLYIMKNQDFNNTLEIVKSIQENNIFKFMRLIDGSDYIKSCLIGFYLDTMRKQNFQLILKYHKDEQYKCEDLDEIFRFNDSDEFLDFFESQGLDVDYLRCEEDDNFFDSNINFNQRKSEEKPLRLRKTNFIDLKRKKRNFDQILVQKDKVKLVKQDEVSRKFLIKGDFQFYDEQLYGNYNQFIFF